jgi:predicted permease
MSSWLDRLLRREHHERELSRELSFHVDQLTEDLVRSGVPRDEARRRALVEFGGVEVTKEDARDARGTRWVEDWIRDTRQALRGMRRSPAFTAAAVLTLAMGIGANTAVWSLVDALMLRALPVAAPEEIRAVQKVGFEDDSYLMSHIRYRRLRAALVDTNALSAMSSSVGMYAIIGDRPQLLSTQLVSGNWFSLLGVGTQLGRPFGPSDDVNLGGHPVVVLSEPFWRARLGGDPSVVGRTLRINGADLTVLGVAESGFTGLTVGAPIDAWIPLMMQHEVKFMGNVYASEGGTSKPWVPQYGVHWLTLVGRFPESEVAPAEARLNVVFNAEKAQEFANDGGLAPAEAAVRRKERIELTSLSRGFSGLREAFSDPLKLLFLSVGTILLIACGNLAGLLLARSQARTHEIAVRISLGARPGRLIRQVLTESLTLALVGGALSVPVAYWGSRALLTIASSGSTAIPLDVPVDGRMLAFALGVTLVAGVLFGLAPALRVTRTNLYDGFKTGGRVVSGGSHRLPLGRVLLIAQIALSLVLVTSAGLFVRSLRNFLSIDPGFQADQVMVARIDVLAAGYTTEQLPALYDRLTAAAKEIPGVKSVALSWLVLGGGARSIAGYTVPGRTFAAGRNTGQGNYVTPGFFSTVGMTLLRGRDFTEADRDKAPAVAIISERTANEFFGTVDVVGKRFGLGTPPELEVVGVVRDARVNSIKETPKRLVFFPLAQGLRHVTNVTVRVSGSAESVAPALRSAISSVDRNLPFYDAIPISTLHERGLSRERMVARIVGALGVLALLLVGVGLYGVVAYSVSRRTNEMGVRLALGASPVDVSRIVLSDSLATILAGLGVGALLELPALKLTQNLVFGIDPYDPRTIALATVLLLAVGVVAALVPALKAARIDPIKAIRAE